MRHPIRNVIRCGLFNQTAGLSVLDRLPLDDRSAPVESGGRAALFLYRCGASVRFTTLTNSPLSFLWSPHRGDALYLKLFPDCAISGKSGRRLHACMRALHNRLPDRRPNSTRHFASGTVELVNSPCKPTGSLWSCSDRCGILARAVDGGEPITRRPFYALSPVLSREWACN